MKPDEKRYSYFGPTLPDPDNKTLAYRTDLDRNGPYSFNGWLPEHYPTELFKARDFIGCLHACMLAFMLIGDAKRTQAAIEDDGILHELIHILHFAGLGDRSLDRVIEWMPDALKLLQEDALKTYEQQLAIQNANTDAAATQQQQQVVSFVDYIDLKPIVVGSAKVRPEFLEPEFLEPKFLEPKFLEIYKDKYFRPEFSGFSGAEQRETGEKEVYQTFTRYRPQDFLPSVAIHQQLLQRPREEESLPTTVNGEAGRRDDVRD